MPPPHYLGPGPKYFLHLDTSEDAEHEEAQQDEEAKAAAAQAPADTLAPAADAPRLSQLDERKDQLSAIARLSIGQFSSAACYMAMMFFALSTAINCVVLDESLDDRAHSSPLLRAALLFLAAGGQPHSVT